MQHRARLGTQSLCRSLVLLLTFTATSLWAWSSSVPDWIKAAAQQTLPKLPESTKAVVLLDDETYTVAPDGRATLHERVVTKILRPQGRQYGQPKVWYDKDSKILSMHAWSIDPAGHEYAAKDNEIFDISPPGDGGDLYDDIRERVAYPPGNDPGGVIAYEYEERERPYLAETTWDVQGEIPVLEQSFTLVLPSGYSYSTNWAHYPKVDAIDLENHHYRWEVNNVPGIDLDQVPLSPSADSLAGRMTVHYSGPGMAVPQDGTWQGIGEWYTALSHDRIIATPEIAAQAAELTAGKTDFYAKAEAIADFVQQQIRYVAIEIGVGGFQPHAAADIFRNRYGDCKDKATLLSAMLSSVGIHSDLVMVDVDRGVIDPDAPSIVGDHMIAAIEIPKGYDSPKLHSVVTAKTGRRYLIFDPTWDETPFGQIEDNLQGSYGLLIEGADSQIIRIPVMDPDLNTLERSANLELTANGTLEGTVTEKTFGDLAEAGRHVFGHEDATKQQEYIDDSVAHDFMAVSLTGLKTENVSDLNKDLTTTFNLQVAHFGNNVGSLLMIRPRVFGSDTLPVDHKFRRVPIDLTQTMQRTDNFNIQLPEGYVVADMPDPVKIDMGFASYESSTVIHGRTLHYSRSFTLRAVSLPPSQYPELQKLDALIGADEDSRVVLERKASAPTP